MDDAGFSALVKQLNQELVGVPDTYGIKVGMDLYAELASRGLLKPKLVDMVLWSWDAPAYLGYVVLPQLDFADFEYRVGTKQP